LRRRPWPDAMPGRVSSAAPLGRQIAPPYCIPICAEDESEAGEDDDGRLEIMVIRTEASVPSTPRLALTRPRSSLAFSRIFYSPSFLDRLQRADMNANLEKCERRKESGRIRCHHRGCAKQEGFRVDFCSLLERAVASLSLSCCLFAPTAPFSFFSLFLLFLNYIFRVYSNVICK
jgi:hypothetical protein